MVVTWKGEMRVSLQSSPVARQPSLRLLPNHATARKVEIRWLCAWSGAVYRYLAAHYTLPRLGVGLLVLTSTYGGNPPSRLLNVRHVVLQTGL